MGKMCVNLQAGENGKKESLTLTVTPRATEMTIPREPDIIHEIFVAPLAARPSLG
jgi:hypothetical protein